MRKSLFRELLVDFFCVVFQIPLDDMCPNRPDSQIPWYISAVFCFVAAVLAIGIWFLVSFLGSR